MKLKVPIESKRVFLIVILDYFQPLFVSPNQPYVGSMVSRTVKSTNKLHGSFKLIFVQTIWNDENNIDFNFF